MKLKSIFEGFFTLLFKKKQQFSYCKQLCVQRLPEKWLNMHLSGQSIKKKKIN